MSLLEVHNLNVEFKTLKGKIHALRNLSFALEEGEVLCIVGESGSGKSVTSLAITQLLSKSANISSGKIFFNNKNLLELSQKEMNRIRGNLISIVFQEPLTSLNPLLKIGFQLSEPVRLHFKLSKKDTYERVVELLDVVGIRDPERIMKQYPNELSGGMGQRIMIAMALACAPKLLIADEPTSALDVTTQAQIMALLLELRVKLRMSIIFVTHDMGVAFAMADKVAVMYAGEIVEIGLRDDIFRRPAHPYTQELLSLVLNIDEDSSDFLGIQGSLPDLYELPKGCIFYDRCRSVFDRCREEVPSFVRCDVNEKKHFAKCWLIEHM